HFEERRGLHRDELPLAAVLRLRLGLAAPRRLHVAADVVLVIDGRVLDVAVQLPEVLRVEHHDWHRRPLAAILRVEELEHDVVVAVGMGRRIRPPRSEDLLAVGNHDIMLEFLDRKSTRLNSSQGSISYAVFSLKKKKKSYSKS